MAVQRENASKFSFMKAEVDDPLAWTLPTKVSNSVRPNGGSLTLTQNDVGSSSRWVHSKATGNLIQDNSKFSKTFHNRKSSVERFEDDVDIDEKINQYEKIIQQELEASSRGGSSGTGSDNLVVSLVKGLEEEMRKVDEVLNSKSKYESGAFNTKNTHVADDEMKNFKKQVERFSFREERYVPHRPSRLKDEQADLSQSWAGSVSHVGPHRSLMIPEDPQSHPNQSWSDSRSRGITLYADSHLGQPTQTVAQEFSREPLSQSWHGNRNAGESECHSIRNPMNQPKTDSGKQYHMDVQSQSWNGRENHEKLHSVGKYNKSPSPEESPWCGPAQKKHKSLSPERTHTSPPLYTPAGVKSYEKGHTPDTRGRWDDLGGWGMSTAERHRTLSTEKPRSSGSHPVKSNTPKSALKKHSPMFQRQGSREYFSPEENGEFGERKKKKVPTATLR